MSARGSQGPRTGDAHGDAPDLKAALLGPSLCSLEPALHLAQERLDDAQARLGEEERSARARRGGSAGGSLSGRARQVPHEGGLGDARLLRSVVERDVEEGGGAEQGRRIVAGQQATATG